MGEDRARLSPRLRRLSCLSFPLFEGFFPDLRAAAPFEFSHRFTLTGEITDNRQSPRNEAKEWAQKQNLRFSVLRFSAYFKKEFKFNFKKSKKEGKRADQKTRQKKQKSGPKIKL